MTKETDQLIQDEIKLEKDILIRINKVQGQLESTKRLSGKKKALLMLELHSATRAIESLKKFVIVDDLFKLRDHIEQGKKKEALELVEDIIVRLEQKASMI